MFAVLGVFLDQFVQLFREFSIRYAIETRSGFTSRKSVDRQTE